MKSFLLLFLIISFHSYGARIFIVESYHSTYEWDQIYISALKEKLKGHTIESFEMDTKRIPEFKFQAQADKALAKIRKFKPDLIILGDDNALKYLSPTLSKGAVPVVFMGINGTPRDYNIKVGQGNITGVLERPLMSRSALIINRLLKRKSSRALLLLDQGVTSNVLIRENFDEEKQIKISGVTVDFKQIQKFSSWKNEVKLAKKNGYDFIILGLYQRIQDENGKHVNENKVINWTSKNSEVPTFGLWEFAVGKNKAVAGYVFSIEEHAKEAGAIAIDILNGKPPSRIYPRQTSKGKIVISESMAKKFNIKLPKGNVLVIP